LGIGDWGLGIGPNPQSPIPNPQSPIPKDSYFSEFKNILKNSMNLNQKISKKKWIIINFKIKMIINNIYRW
jgi:hypothetical protein